MPQRQVVAIRKQGKTKTPTEPQAPVMRRPASQGKTKTPTKQKAPTSQDAKRSRNERRAGTRTNENQKRGERRRLAKKAGVGRSSEWRLTQANRAQSKEALHARISIDAAAEAIANLLLTTDQGDNSKSDAQRVKEELKVEAERLKDVGMHLKLEEKRLALLQKDMWTDAMSCIGTEKYHDGFEAGLLHAYASYYRDRAPAKRTFIEEATAFLKKKGRWPPVV